MNLPYVKRSTALAVSTIIALSSNAQANQLEEVMVTAQKYAQSNQDVPIAVTAMDADMLKKTGVSSVVDVAVRTPGFSMGEFNPAQPQLYIRGIGSNGDGAASGEQSVAMFVDGVYVNRSAGSGTDLFDLESIEILRGPQGTLWGKNAIAGAINITTKKPTDELEAGFDVTVGNLGLKNVRGMVSGPLADSVNGKLSVNVKERDGYVTSVIDPSIEQGAIDNKGARGQLSFLPTDSLELLWTLDYNHSDRNMASISSDDVGINGAVLAAAWAGGVPKAGFYENYLDYQGNTELENQSTSLKADWDLDAFTFSSLTSFSQSETHSTQDGMAIAPEIYDNYGSFSTAVLGPLAGVSMINHVDEKSTMVTQEFHLAGISDNLVWQTGVFLSREDVDRTEGNTMDAPAFMLAPFKNNVMQVLTYGKVDDSAVQANVTTSYAIFGQGTYSITDLWDVTLGLRYTEETKDFTNDSVLTSLSNPGVPEITTSYGGKKTWNAPSYKLVTSYHFVDDAMAYLSVATGFKSGGFNYSSTLSPSVAEPFNQENALNYELGMKGTWFDKTLRTNAAIFRTEYEDLQVLQQFACGDCSITPLITKNAGEAISQGLELELMYILGEHFTLSGSYAYLDATYTKLEGTLAKDEGNTLRNAPRNAYTAAISYQTDLSSGAMIDARLEYMHKEKAYQDTANYEYATIPEYRTVDSRIAYTSSNEQWELALWGKNLLDEEYYLHNFQLPPFGAVHVPATGRTYGLSVTWKTY